MSSRKDYVDEAVDLGKGVGLVAGSAGAAVPVATAIANTAPMTALLAGGPVSFALGAAILPVVGGILACVGIGALAGKVIGEMTADD